MSEFLIQSAPHPSALRKSLGDRLRALESDQPNADAKEKLHFARARVVAATQRAEAAEQEMACSCKEVSDTILAYKDCQIGHKGEWTRLRDVIAIELGVSIRGLYRIIALSGSPASVNGSERASSADRKNRADNSSDPSSATNRLRAELAERVSRRLRQRNRSESDDDFRARFVAEVAARKRHTKAHSTAAVVQLIQQIAQTSGVSQMDFESIRVAPD